MINSMTAFASAKATTDSDDITCELRTVNHRYLDVHVKLPETLRDQEAVIRDKIKQYLSRGKVDVLVNINATTDDQAMLTINQPLVDRLIQATSQMSAGQAMQPLSAECLLTWPGVIQKPTLDSARISKALIQALDVALKRIVNVRYTEGQALNTFIQQRIAAITVALAKIKQYQPAQAKNRKAALQQKFDESSLKLDPERLEQEMVLYLQKADISEETDRLDAHLNALQTMLTEGGVIGRKLDFMMQELNRETNTIGSKSTHFDTTQETVAIKVLIEQMREQIQNIE